MKTILNLLILASLAISIGVFGTFTAFSFMNDSYLLSGLYSLVTVGLGALFLKEW